MKIRTDFVTNSSSSSFISFNIKNKKLPELIKKYLDGESIKDGEYSEDMCGDVWFSIDENGVEATMESESFNCDLLESVIEFVRDNSYYVGNIDDDDDYEYEYREGDGHDDVRGSASTSYLSDSAVSIMCEIAKAAVGEEKTEKAMKIIKELYQDYRETSCEIKASYNTQF